LASFAYLRATFELPFIFVLKYLNDCDCPDLVHSEMNLLELISGISGATACLVLIALATIPSVLALKGCLSRGARPNRQFPLYEDEDGTATEESQASFSDSVPRYGILLWSLVGSVAALAAALYVTVDPGFIGSIIPCFWFLFATAVSYNSDYYLLFTSGQKNNKFLSFLEISKHSSSSMIRIPVAKPRWGFTRRSLQ
jgi:hypothetical protein